VFDLYIPWRDYARLNGIHEAFVKRDAEIGKLRTYYYDDGNGALFVWVDCVPKRKVHARGGALIAAGCDIVVVVAVVPAMPGAGR
jgi:hypothetical protein